MKTDKFAAIDGLRGLAIIMVTLYHIWGHMRTPDVMLWGLDLTPLFCNGHMGVPLFFTLSGFCLFYPMVKKGAPTSWREFFLRRAWRILPGYWLSLVVFFIPFAVWAGTKETLWQLLSHATFTETFFEPHRLAVNAVWWSLAVEIHYYLIFPFLALAFLRWPVATFAACMAISLGIRGMAMHDILTPWQLWCINLPARLCEFGAGMMVAHLVVSRPNLLEHKRLIMACEILGIVAIFIMPYANLRGHGVERGIMSIGWGALALAVLSPLSGFRQLFTMRPLVWIGIVSYSAYLYNAAFQFTPLHKPLADGQLWAAVLAFASVLVFGWLGYLIAEKPFMKMREKLRKEATPALPAGLPVVHSTPGIPANRGFASLAE